MKTTHRRDLLKWSMLGAGGLLLQRATARAAELCQKTPTQPEGPFYPGELQIMPLNDLTRVQPQGPRAKGVVVRVNGIVRDQHCQPVEGVNVEIWQACASGKYNHPNDPNPAPLDPNFRYWGEAFTNAQGEYSFLTIKPGAYPAAEAWVRPPHIHFRVMKRGYIELITQLYFAGDPLNEKDLILQRLSPQEQKAVTVNFAPRLEDWTLLQGQFDLTLEKIS